MRWTVHGERPVYSSSWIDLNIADVEIPTVGRIDHHVVRMPQQAAGTVVRDAEGRVLLLWRHRFITDTWGWEIPAGRIDPGEAPIEAAAREAEEETGWRPHGLAPLTAYHPSNGLSDQTFHLFLADGATEIGPPTDLSESSRVEWRTPAQVRRAALDGEIGDGLSLTALLWALAFGLLSVPEVA